MPQMNPPKTARQAQAQAAPPTPLRRTALALPGGPPAAMLAPLTAEPAQRVLRQFRLVFNSVKTHFQQMERHAGIGGAQVWAMSIIRDQPGVGVNSLAKAMDVRQPTASNLVKALADQGLIEVRKEGVDRRAVQLYLRPGGAEVLLRAPGPFSGVLPQALAGLESSTLLRLEQDLGTLIRALGACRAWGVDSENRPQRGQFLPDLQPRSPARGQKDGEKWTAAVDSQPTLPKPDRLPDPDERAASIPLRRL